MRLYTGALRETGRRRDRFNSITSIEALQWRHNGHDGVSNHQPNHCLLNRLFGCRWKKHQSSASLAFVWGIHWGPVNSPHKWPVTQKIFPFDDVITRLFGLGPWWGRGLVAGGMSFPYGTPYNLMIIWIGITVFLGSWLIFCCSCVSI